MNIEFQIAGFCVVLLLAILFTTKRSLNLYSSKIFMDIMGVTLVLLFTDILSVVAITYKDYLPLIWVEVICKLYVTFLIAIVSSALLYIANDALGEIKHRKFSKIIIGLDLIGAVGVFLLPIKIYSEGRIVYTYGPCTTFVYAFVMVYFAAIFVIMIAKRKIIYKRRLVAFLVWSLVWIGAAVIQLFDSQLLLVGFATSLGTIVLYVMLENPETNIDRQLGCFNSYAMTNYLNELYGRNEAFHVFSFCFDEIFVEQDELIKRLLTKVYKFKHSYIFKGLNTDFLLVIKDENDAKIITDFINKEANSTNGEGLLKDVHIAFLENGLKAGSSEDIQKLFDYYHLEFHHVSGETINIITDQMVIDFLNSNKMSEEILLALEEDRVEVHLQPIFSLRTNTFTSAEALVRIRGKDGSLIPPGLFIPVAESTGLIVELGERIFEKTCKFLADYKPWEYGFEYVEVNLSVVQCEQANLSKRLTDIMSKYDISPKRVNLEITETATLNAKKKLLKNMDILMKEGCTFSLDDFGKGESNLMYIVEMPVSIVKLDYDMTKAFHEVPKAKSVVRSVVSMAHEMGLHIVAEGIENEKELESMREVGIDYIQGYYFSKPLPIEQYYSFICEKNK